MKCKLLLSSILALFLLMGSARGYSAFVYESQDQAEEERSLAVTISGCVIERYSDSLCLITADLELMNWSLETISLKDGVSASLFYLDFYEYPAAITFPKGENEIGMLESAEGQVTVKAPNQAALAMEDLELHITIGGKISEEVVEYSSSLEAIRDKIPDNESEEAISDSPKLTLGKAYIRNKLNGESDEKHKWLIQEFELANWSSSFIFLPEDLTAELTYKEVYSFEAETDVPNEDVLPLQQIKGKLIFNVPTIVAEAKEGELTCSISLGDLTREEAVTIGTSEENPFWEAAVGDLIEFGRYEQDGDKTNGEEAIEWRVLAVEDGKALIISEYALDAKPYNTEFVAITWEGCTLRSWLNDDFYQAIFSEDEQDWIVETQVINEDNPDYKTVGGNDTEDKVFLLSIAEANEYFADDEDRKVYETPCAKDNGTYVNKDISTSWWWLRSPGLNSTYAAAVDVNGWVIACGDYVFFTNGGVRPALWITLES